MTQPEERASRTKKSCEYAGSAFDNYAPCREPARLHVLVHNELVAEYTDVIVCNRHLAAVFSVGPVMCAHFYSIDCVMPGTIWQDSGCIIDDSGVSGDICGGQARGSHSGADDQEGQDA